MKILPPATRIGLFVRVSTDDQVRGESPEAHIETGQNYAKIHEWLVVAVYQLDGVSGTAMMDEAETRRMWRDAETGFFDALLFTAVARVGRNMFDLFKIERHLKAHKKYLVDTRRGVIDTDTQEGLDYFFHSAHRAHSESIELSTRVKTSLITRAKLGQFTAAKTPYGYRKAPIPGSNNGKMLEIDPIEGPIRALMYDLYLHHRKLMRVANDLNGRGYRNREGKPFRHGHIKNLLLDSSASGIYYANCTGRKGVKKPESEWIEIPCPALVSLEDWQRCRSAINSKSYQTKVVTYPYSGLLRCCCKRMMYVQTNFSKKTQSARVAPRYVCRGCRNMIHMSQLDHAIGKAFTGFLLDGLPDGSESEISKSERQLQGLQADLKKIKSSIKQWEDAYEAGAIDLSGFERRNTPLIERERSVAEEVSRLESERRTAKEQRAAQDRASEVLQAAKWADLEVKDKHEILREFVEVIELNADTIKIQMFHTPTLLQIGDDAERDQFAQLHTLTVRRPDQAIMPTDRRAWGYWLRHVRKERGESARAVAKRLGVVETYLGRWELLAKPPGSEYLEKIARYIGFVPWCRTPYVQPTIGAAVRAAREIRGLTQDDLSELTGISQGMISYMELGRGLLSATLFDKLEGALKIEVRKIFKTYNQSEVFSADLRKYMV